MFKYSKRAYPFPLFSLTHLNFKYNYWQKNKKNKKKPSNIINRGLHHPQALIQPIYPIIRTTTSINVTPVPHINCHRDLKRPFLMAWSNDYRPLVVHAWMGAIKNGSLRMRWWLLAAPQFRIVWKTRAPSYKEGRSKCT